MHLHAPAFAHLPVIGEGCLIGAAALLLPILIHGIAPA